ncbi:MAG: hypothetical protein ABR609_01530 [Acidimicrobiia bacterium]
MNSLTVADSSGVVDFFWPIAHPKCLRRVGCQPRWGAAYIQQSEAQIGWAREAGRILRPVLIENLLERFLM